MEEYKKLFTWLFGWFWDARVKHPNAAIGAAGLSILPIYVFHRNIVGCAPVILPRAALVITTGPVSPVSKGWVL